RSSPSATVSVPETRSTGFPRAMRSASCLLPGERPARRTRAPDGWRSSIRQRSGSASGNGHRCVAGEGRIVDGAARTSTSLAGLVDANVLVYRFDARFPDKQRIATEVLRRGLADDTVRLPHQAIVEFVAAVSRPLGDEPPLLDAADARREAEELLLQFTILYPNDAVVRTALRGAAAYHLSWFDAQLWAYAEHYAMDELLT